MEGFLKWTVWCLSCGVFRADKITLPRVICTMTFQNSTLTPLSLCICQVRVVRFSVSLISSSLPPLPPPPHRLLYCDHLGRAHLQTVQWHFAVSNSIPLFPSVHARNHIPEGFLFTCSGSTDSPETSEIWRRPPRYAKQLHNYTLTNRITHSTQTQIFICKFQVEISINVLIEFSPLVEQFFANLLAFFLAYLLTFRLTVFAYLLTFCVAFFLAYLLTFFMALFPAFCLTYLLTLFLPFYLANLLPRGCGLAGKAGRGWSRLRSGWTQMAKEDEEDGEQEDEEEMDWRNNPHLTGGGRIMFLFGWKLCPETIIAPENGWLEDCFPLGEANFQGLCWFSGGYFKQMSSNWR